MNSDIKIRWYGDNIYGHTGYANNVRELLYAMHQLGADAKAIMPPLPKGEYIPSKCAPIFTTEIDIDKETHVAGRTYVYDEFLKQWQNKAKSISAILVLEGDKLPENWIAIANCMDAVYTASEYGKRQFIANGIVPELVKVVPHGIDPEIFHPNPHLKRPRYLEDKFIFLYTGGFALPGDRKGADLAALAFAHEFKPWERAVLCLKINPIYNPQFDAAGYIRYITNGYPNIFVINESYNQNQLAELYNISDIHVMPSMGEAFSMNLAESMACGKPVITTNWSGPLDYCLPEFSYLVDIEGWQTAHYGKWDIECGTKWAVPSYWDLRRQMRYAFDNQQEVHEKGRAAQRHIIDNYLWRHAAEKMIKVLREMN